MFRKVCQTCGDEFFVYVGRKDTAKCCSIRCSGIYKKKYTGARSCNWKGGKTTNIHGYVLIRVDGAYKYEHRHVVECHIGRTLKRREVVHHVDGDKTNNAIHNLVVMDKSEHDRIEALRRIKANKSGTIRTKKTPICGAPRLGRKGRGKFCKKSMPCHQHKQQGMPTV